MAKKTTPRRVPRIHRREEATNTPIDSEERRRESLRRRGVADAVAAAKAVEPLLREALAER